MIKTSRCYLRIATKEDAGNICSFQKANLPHFEQWDPPKPTSFYTTNYWETFSKKALSEYENKESLRLIIFSNVDDTVIGMISFTHIEKSPSYACRLGYKISKNFEGQGLMKESLYESINYLFKNYKVHRIDAGYMISNTRSKMLLEKLGFKKIGIAEKYIKIHNQFEDHELTQLINSNFTE